MQLNPKDQRPVLFDGGVIFILSRCGPPLHIIKSISCGIPVVQIIAWIDAHNGWTLAVIKRYTKVVQEVGSVLIVQIVSPCRIGATIYC